MINFDGVNFSEHCSEEVMFLLILSVCNKVLKPYIVLVDLNEFSSVILKVQHSYSRHQKTTSNLLTITLDSQ